MHDWPGRAHAETLRAWPELVQTVERIQARRDLFAGALLLGSLSRGEGDAVSDVDLIAVTRAGRWDDAWAVRGELSAGALVTFDRLEGRALVGGHSWLSPELVKVECLVAEPGGGVCLFGDVVVVLGDPTLPDGFERRPPLTRAEIDAYVADLREQDRLPEIERVYGELVTLLRRELRGA
jgi:predicted nucleotidyltransferase